MFQEPQKRTVRELLSSRKLAIPIYQRGYAWTDDEVDDYVEDIGDLWKSPAGHRKQHFLGMMLCYNRVDDVWTNVLELIDGQQRLTTTSLLLLAFREGARSLEMADAATPELVKTARTL